MLTQAIWAMVALNFILFITTAIGFFLTPDLSFFWAAAVNGVAVILGTLYLESLE